MYIKVKLYGSLRRLSGPGTPGLWEGEVPASIRLVDLIHILGTKPAEVALGTINGQVCPLDTEIPEGAEITLVTPVGGG